MKKEGDKSDIRLIIGLGALSSNIADSIVVDIVVISFINNATTNAITNATTNATSAISATNAIISIIIAKEKVDDAQNCFGTTRTTRWLWYIWSSAEAVFGLAVIGRRTLIKVLIDSRGMLEILNTLPSVLNVPFVLPGVMVPIVGRHKAHGPKYYLTNVSTSSSGHGPDSFFGPIGWCHCLGSKCSNWLV